MHSTFRRPVLVMRTPGRCSAFYSELLARLSQTGGVQSVGTTSHLPMYRFGDNGEMQIEGKLPWDANNAPLVEYRWFAGDYFQTMGIPLLEGRMLDARDGRGTTTVLVNRTMAEKFWPGESAIGKRFGQGRPQPVVAGRRRDRRHAFVWPYAPFALRVPSFDRAGRPQRANRRPARRQR